MANTPVRVPKMAELVAAQLRRKIVRGELAEGDALPAETALMAEFAVSRPTLREASLVVELAGNETLTVLTGMVRHIIDQANWSHVDLDAGTPENIRANRRGFRAHVALVDLVAARRAEAAEELWWVHLQEAEDYLLQNRSMTTVLDLLG